MEKAKCAKCGSYHMMTGLRLSGGEYNATVGVGANWIGLPAKKSEFSSTVCADCGYTEIYADNPQGLWEEWRKKNA